MPAYPRVHPLVIDPKGVAVGIEPRPMAKGSDAERAATVRLYDGQPSVDFDGTSNPYNNYQSIDLLLSLQHLRSEGYDEHCFYVMGQVKELLFKGLHFELYNAQHHLRHDRVAQALEILPRARAFIEYIGASWNVLSTITPEGFNQFRDHLGSASGQLSYQYRHVEFILGNKSARLASAFRNMPHVWPGIEQALNSPSLYDDTIALLARRGHAIDKAMLERDWSLNPAADPSVERAWLAVYADPSPHNELYRLGEAMIALADSFTQYRWRHFVSVQRIIGLKPGTGGSAGVGWLQHVTSHRFFPELWSIRTML
jgi:tryptophan 2,3-dioxygenase